MAGHGSPAAAREVRDCYGRQYRWGEHPRDLIGRSRSAMLWLAWAPMAVVGVLQYGYGAMVPALVERHGWSAIQAFWLLAVWAVFQAGVGFPTAYLRERDRVGPRPVMVAGAALCLIGLVTLAHGPGILGVLVGYSVLGGTGVGLVYAACTSTVAKWYPEQMGARVSFVTGAFAYGSVPFVVAVVLAVDASNLTPVLDVVGVLLCLVVATCGVLFRDPPANWWPPHVDPREWTLGHSLNPGRLKNLPATRQFSPRQALHTGALPVMYVILSLAGAVSLFNVAFLVTFAAGIGAGAGVVALVAGLLAGISGVGRAVVVGISDHLGRCRALGLVMLVQALAQFCFVPAATAGSAAMLVVAATLAGLGGGAFYPLFAGLAREYFGGRNALEVHALVYSAKAFGGVAGVGLAVLAIAAWGYPAVFLLAGCLSLGSAALSRRLRRPGLLHTLPAPSATEPAADETAGQPADRVRT